MTERDKTMDTLKGIGIFLVVLGHARGLPDDIHTYIYSFHMPLFLFCSGYLMFVQTKEINMVMYIKKSFFKIMIPFYGAYSLSFFVTLLLEKETRNITFFKDFILGGLFASKWMQVNNFALWYLSMFLIATVLFKFLIIKGDKVVLLVGLIGFILSPSAYKLLTNSEEKILWNINVVFPAIFFMALGYFANKYAILKKLRDFKYSLIIIACGFVGLFISFKFPSEILYIENYWYLIAAVLTLLFIIWLNLDNQNQILMYLGRYSFDILIFHRIINMILMAINLDDFLKNWGITGLMFSIVITVITIICTLIPKIVKNQLPNLMVKR